MPATELVRFKLRPAVLVSKNLNVGLGEAHYLGKGLLAAQERLQLLLDDEVDQGGIGVGRAL